MCVYFDREGGSSLHIPHRTIATGSRVWRRSSSGKVLSIATFSSEFGVIKWIYDRISIFCIDKVAHFSGDSCESNANAIDTTSVYDNFYHQSNIKFARAVSHRTEMWGIISNKNHICCFWIMNNNNNFYLMLTQNVICGHRKPIYEYKQQIIFIAHYA